MPVTLGGGITMRETIELIVKVTINYPDKKQRKEAIKLLVETLTNICRNTGHKYSYALIKNNSLIETYEDLGYVKGDKYTIEMIKVL